jgi:hypothetical protein
MGTLHEDQSILMITFRLIIVIMGNVVDKSCTGNQNTHFMFNNFFGPKITPFVG